MKRIVGLTTSTLVLGALLGTAMPAVAADAPPPRTSASVSDPAYDTTGTDPNRRSRADVRVVDYTMPLPRNRRILTIETTLRRVGFRGFGGSDAPSQQVRTLIDGPGGRDYAVTVYNSSRSPRVVSLAGDRPRRIQVQGAGWGGGAGRNETLDVQLTTEWMRGLRRADLTTTGTSGQATDRARTAPRLNTRYAGRSGSGGMSQRQGGSGTSAAPSCTQADDGSFSCSYGTL